MEAVPSCEAWNTEEYSRAATVEAVTTCLDAGADMTARTEYGYKLRHRVAEYKENPVVIETLLVAGVNPVARDLHGETPLHREAFFNENPAVTDRTGSSLGGSSNAVELESSQRPLGLS